MRTLLSLLLVALAAIPALASKPIHYRFEGCVVDGLMIAVSGNRITPLRRATDRAPFEPKRYEGKQISVTGSLLPGDHFFPNPAAVKVLGACRLTKDARFRNGLAWAHRAVARNQLAAGRLDEALKAIERAIRLAPKVYAFFLVRAQIHAKARRHEKAAADIARCLTLAKDETERGWCRKALAR